MHVAILMPTFNEPLVAETLRAVRARAAGLGGVTVFLVDDGSEPAVAPACFPEQTAEFRVVLARHIVNLGQGAALETARQLALGPYSSPAFAAYVTMDSDGQHRASDLAALVRSLDEADVAFGNRFSGDSNVPATRRFILAAARIFERAITGVTLSDAHNGFRAFRRDALASISITENGMAHATEIRVRVARGGLSVAEVPVSIRYTRASGERGQSSLGALAIVRDLFHRYLFEESK